MSWILVLKLIVLMLVATLFIMTIIGHYYDKKTLHIGVTKGLAHDQDKFTLRRID